MLTRSLRRLSKPSGCSTASSGTTSESGRDLRPPQTANRLPGGGQQLSRHLFRVRPRLFERDLAAEHRFPRLLERLRDVWTAGNFEVVAAQRELELFVVAIALDVRRLFG